ncbi:MAG: Xaa-Pro peptidase family protein [Alphaproteobacteria bacterium]|nr:Xaa-Pro peptidase family protein [Alphaproteobacteria bacterium]
MMDFPIAEFQARLKKTQKLMYGANIDALFLTREAEIFYFSGFRTLFWQSPTRPWFLIIPQKGEPIAIIPTIGKALMAQTWVKDIRTWASPHPNDDGISLLTDALKSYQTIGILKGNETHLHMPLNNFETLTQKLSAHNSSTQWVDCTKIIQTIRGVKSPAEIAIIHEMCQIASKSFLDIPNIIHQGQSLKQAFHAFKISLLQHGADDVPYLVGGADNPCYHDIIAPPSDKILQQGDVLMLDTGATLKGYFCDFNRNFAIGKADDTAKRAYETLWRATEAGLKAARAGITAADLFHAMNEVIKEDAGNINASNISTGGVGRYGHGLGIALTEWPSFFPLDETVLQENMVITLEPSIELPDGSIMVTEENIVITNGAPQLLTTRAAETLPVIG